MYTVCACPSFIVGTGLYSVRNHFTLYPPYHYISAGYIIYIVLGCTHFVPVSAPFFLGLHRFNLLVSLFVSRCLDSYEFKLVTHNQTLREISSRQVCSTHLKKCQKNLTHSRIVRMPSSLSNIHISASRTM